MSITFFVNPAKGDGITLAIKLADSTPVQYCNGLVKFAESLTVEGNFILPGMKISINEGYNVGEDTLVYSVSIGNIVSTWDDRIGCLHLKGDANTTVDNYRDAIKSVRYKNNKLIPTLGTRKITITLEDGDYFLGTEHFYRFVPKPGIKWTEAEAEAKSDAMKYYGLRGYLATITSGFENSFIQSKTQGVGWIGASDAAIEGDWRWVTGPEGLSGGLLFWKGTGYQAKMNNPSGVYGPVNGAYHNWNKWDQGFSSSTDPCTWEPNNSGNGICGPNIAPGEDYAHITYFPNNSNNSYKWNDLPNTGGSGDYASAGYLIEFGDMPGDPEVYLSATLQLQVNTVFFTNKGIQAAICEGDTVVLNKADTTHAVYRWTPADGSLSSLTIASPTAKPKVTTTYFVTGTRGVCTDTATYKVKVISKPIVSLGRDTTICNPGNILLTTRTQFESYHWLPNAETTSGINVTKDGFYSVNVTDAFGCKASAEIKVSFKDKPKIILSDLETLICGPFATTMKITANENVSYSFIKDPKVKISGLTASVSPADFGSYPITVIAKDEFSCLADTTFILRFYKTPTVSFDFDSTTCKGYNLPARYKGDADTIVSNFKWIFGGETIADTIGRNFLVVPLGINRAQRDLQLTVTQDGCSNTFIQPNIKVIPNLDLQIIDSLGCEPFNAEFKAVNTEVVKYFWDFGDNSPVKEGMSNTSHIYQKAAYYDVRLKVTTVVASGDGCTNEVKIESMVHVAPIPDIAFSLSPDVCLEPGGNEISYTGSIGTVRDKYDWDLSQFDQSEIINDPHLTQGPLKFDLKTKPMATIGLKVTSEFGCESLPGSILVKRKPDFSIQSDLLVGCVPFEPTLSGIINGSGDAVDFSWDFGDGTTGSGSPTLHTYNAPGKNFNLILNGKSSVSGCVNVKTGTDLLKTNPKPAAKFKMDNKIVYNDKPDVKFTDQSSGASGWLWNFGEESTSAEQNPIYHFLRMGPQKVTLEVSNAEGCTDAVSDTVLVAFDRLFPPNGFSPNAPNSVDQVFLLNSEGITPEGYHFAVLSRWNDVVFETKGEIKGWDGRMINGTFAPAGVYVWILNFSDFLGRKHQQTGTVTLVY